MPHRPDRHQLYETAVQQPERMVALIERSGRPRWLREDFCGTANLSTAWVRSAPDRRAIAIDRDAAVLRYAERRHRRALGTAGARLRLLKADVLRCRTKADAIISLNFSHFIYKTRPDLLHYFRHVRRCLNPSGRFICDVYGGPGAMRVGVEERRFGDFTYLWEQASYDPATAAVVNHIHFQFPDGSELRRAFTYRWRLWTLPELRELLAEAGFSRVDVSLADPTADAWIAYLVARR